MSSPKQDPWWSRAVFYQIYPRSFADSDGDGVGDLDGVLAHLDYLDLLGVNAIWINPVTVSPMADHGYDVADPRDVDQLFGGLAALERLITAAHDRNIKITMDLVPNHTSSAHPWFQTALVAGPGSAARDRYIFRDGRGRGGHKPPNNWQSVFGGPAWTRVVEPDGKPGPVVSAPVRRRAARPELGQPARCSTTSRRPCGSGWNAESTVSASMSRTAWPNHRAFPTPRSPRAHGCSTTAIPGSITRGVHAIHRDIRTVMDDYPHAVTIGEVWVFDNAQWAEYLRPDELHLGFNFRLVRAKFDIDSIRDAIENSLAAAAIANANPTWTLENHDVEREGHPVRRRQRRAGPGAGHGDGDARPAGRGVSLQRAGTGAAQRRIARRSAARSDVGTLRAHRPRPGRLPHPDAVARRDSPVRVLRDRPTPGCPFLRSGRP